MISKLATGSNKWKACKYELKVEIKFSDGTVRKLKKAQIAGLYLEKDYDNDHLPVLLLDVSLSRKDQNLVDDETEFHLRINQFYQEEEDGEKKEPKIYLNETFVKINLGTNPDTSTKIDEEIRKQNGLSDDDVAMEDLMEQQTYPLIKKSDNTLIRKIVNTNLVNVNQKAVMCALLFKAKCKKPMLISNFTNATSIGELNVKPKTLMENLIYMKDEYGWHKEGTYLFFDYDILYVIRMNGACTAWRDNEPKTVYFCISEVSSSDNVPSGVLIKDTAVYYNIGTEQYEKVDATNAGEQIEGNGMLLIDTSTGSGTTVTSDTKSSGAYNTKVYHGHNPYLAYQYKRRKLEQENQLSINCKNGDLSFLTPNKQFKIVTDVTEIAKEFKGNYRLGGFKTSFIKNGEYFDTTTEINIKRVTK
jgi:hypothetical protein